jgi:hypothetical protein
MTYAERVRVAIRDPEWQKFRRSLKGMDTASKLNNLRAYNQDSPHYFKEYNRECPWCVRVDNYLKALARGGQLYAGVSLEQALAWDWNLRIRK